MKNSNAVELTKHHGLGNDFLIALEPERTLGPDDARAWCNRRTGIGADGLILARRGDTNGTPSSDRGPGHHGEPEHWTMTLWNADGGEAEISGNGIRCLGQAIVMSAVATAADSAAGREPVQVVVGTAAGSRMLAVAPSDEPEWSVSASMGSARPGQELPDGWGRVGVSPRHQMTVDLGNPHLVAVVDSLDPIDMAIVGPAIEAEYPDGMNVHCVTADNDNAIDLVVWERGVGITQACGSGACAAAWVARQLGLAEDKIAVTMPGGSATVVLTGDDIDLIGPAAYIGRVFVG